jgi:hypothetical protein
MLDGEPAATVKFAKLHWGRSYLYVVAGMDAALAIGLAWIYADQWQRWQMTMAISTGATAVAVAATV